jgi:hypothetical protein
MRGIEETSRNSVALGLHTRVQHPYEQSCSCVGTLIRETTACSGEEEVSRDGVIRFRRCQNVVNAGKLINSAQSFRHSNDTVFKC